VEVAPGHLELEPVLGGGQGVVGGRSSAAAAMIWLGVISPKRR
jgi:hypothetical protein